MNLTVNSQLLAQELRLLSKIAPDKPALPILSNVLLVADEQLSLQATDLQVSVSTTCQATIQRPGTVALPAKKLLEMVEHFPNADVQLTLEKGSVRVISGSFKSRLQTLPAGDFPPMPVMEGDVTTLSAQSLCLLIERTRYAISDKPQKFVMAGALLSLSGEAAAMVATDGKRLSLSTVLRVAGPDLTAILPNHAMDTFLSLSPVGDVEFSQGPRHLFFSVGARLLTSRMLEGKFPNYQRIVPQNNDKVITIDRVRLASALRRVGVVSEQDQAVTFEFGEGSVLLTSKSATVGEADEQVDADYVGSPLKLCINGQYALDFLETAVGETITLSVKDGRSALLLTDGVDFINVIMPRRA